MVFDMCGGPAFYLSGGCSPIEINVGKEREDG